MEVKSSIEINLDDVFNRLGIGPNDDSTIAYMADACYRYMDKYVPKSNGHYDSATGLFIPGGQLRKQHEIYKDSPSRYIIEYQSPYAHAQYIGYTKGPVRNYTTPGTGKYWDKLMLSAEKEKLIKEIERYMGRK